MDPLSKPWHKKKRYILPLAALGFTTLAYANSSPTVPEPTITAPTSSYEVPTLDASPTEAQQSNNSYIQQDTHQNSLDNSDVNTEDNTAQQEDQQSLENDTSYRNSNGDETPSPTPLNDCAANGGTAICGDGSCSFSAHRQGTCSRHGGVSEWL